MDSATLTCSVRSGLASTPQLALPASSSGYGAGASAFAAAPPLAIFPSALTFRRGSSTCLSLPPLSLQLADVRGWWAGTGAGTSAGPGIGTGGSSSSGSISNNSSNINGTTGQSILPSCPLLTSAMNGYSVPTSQLAYVRCDLTAAGDAGVISTVSALAAVARAAIPLIADILVVRQTAADRAGRASSASAGSASTGAWAYLESMRSGLSEPVLPGCGWLAAAAEADADAISSTNSSSSSSSADDPGPAAAWLSAHEASQALAAAAHRLGLQPSTSTTARAITLSGSSTLVIMMQRGQDTSAPVHFHSPSLLAAQGARAAAHEAAVRQFNASERCVASDNASVFRQSRFDPCTSADYAAAVVALTTVAQPLRLAIYVGGIKANITYVAPDGSQVHVSTPTYAQLCGDAAEAAASGAGSASCGYQRLRLQYEPDDGSVNTGSNGVDASASAPASRQRQRQLQALAIDPSPTPTPGVGAQRQLQALATDPSPTPTPGVGAQWVAPLLDVAGRHARGEATVAEVTAALNAATVPAPPVSCPPFCPSLMPPSQSQDEGVGPLAVSLTAAGEGQPAPGFQAWMGALVPAVLTPEAGPAAALPSEASGFATAGLFYTSQCVGWAPVDSGACSNASSPELLSGQCAFGGGDACRMCPRINGAPAAVCPGGFRAWPLPGFFTPAESSGVVSPCAPPSSRCLGWDAATGSVRCAPGYRPYSAGCLSCADGFYPANDASCTACPAGSGELPRPSRFRHCVLSLLLLPFVAAACHRSNHLYVFLALTLFILCHAAGFAAIARAIGLFVGAALSVLLLILGLTWLIAKAMRGEIIGGFAQAADLCAWIVATLQVLSSVGRTASVGLPPLVGRLFAGLAALEFDNVALPSACWRVYPFASEVTICTAVLCLALGLWTWVCCARRPYTPSLATELIRRLRDRLATARRGGAHADDSASKAKLVGNSCTVTRGSAAASKLTLPTAASTAAAPVTSPAKLPLSQRVLAALPMLAFTASTLLYPLTARTVFKLLSCTPVSLTPLARASLDKDGGITVETLLKSAVTSGLGNLLRGQLATVSVLTSNSNFVCYQGSHRPAALIAWITLVTYVVAYPLWSFVWARRRVVAHMEHSASLPGGSSTDMSKTIHSYAADAAPVPTSGSAGWSDLLAADEAALRTLYAKRPVSGRAAVWCCGRQRTMRFFAKRLRVGVASGPSAPISATLAVQAISTVKTSGEPAKESSEESEAPWGMAAAAAMDGASVVINDGPLRHFAGSTYRPSVVQMRLRDMYLLGCLSAASTYWPAPTSTDDAAGRGVIITALLLGAAWFIATRQPFPEGQTWKLYVKVGSLLLAALATILTHFGTAVALRWGSDGPGAAATSDQLAAYDSDVRSRAALSYLVFVGCIVLLATLALGFWSSSIRRRPVAKKANFPHPDGVANSLYSNALFTNPLAMPLPQLGDGDGAPSGRGKQGQGRNRAEFGPSAAAVGPAGRSSVRVARLSAFDDMDASAMMMAGAVPMSANANLNRERKAGPGSGAGRRGEGSGFTHTTDHDGEGDGRDRLAFRATSARSTSRRTTAASTSTAVSAASASTSPSPSSSSAISESASSSTVATKLTPARLAVAPGSGSGVRARAQVASATREQKAGSASASGSRVAAAVGGSTGASSAGRGGKWSAAPSGSALGGSMSMYRSDKVFPASK